MPPESIDLWQQEVELLREVEDLIDHSTVSDALAAYLTKMLQARVHELLASARLRGARFPHQLLAEMMEVCEDTCEFLRASSQGEDPDDEPAPVTLEKTYNTVPNIPGLPGAPRRIQGLRPDLIPGINDMSAAPRDVEHLRSLESSYLG